MGEFWCQSNLLWRCSAPAAVVLQIGFGGNSTASLRIVNIRNGPKSVFCIAPTEGNSCFKPLSSAELRSNRLKRIQNHETLCPGVDMA